MVYSGDMPLYASFNEGLFILAFRLHIHVGKVGCPRSPVY